MNLPPMKMPTVRQTVLRSAAVLAVCAAVASFSHIYSFARAAGQTPAIAVLYPGSTDVLVACATACLLHASRNKLKATFARWAFAVGVAATVAANIGDHFRPIPFPVGAVVSGWPAVSFVLAVVLVHWFWNSGTGNLPAGDGSARRKEGTQTGRFPVPGGTEGTETETITERTLNVPERDERQEPQPGTGRFPVETASPTRQEGTQTGNLPVFSKTDRVLEALQKARARGENPTAASLAQECEVSPTLARNVVRASSNGTVSNGSTS